MGIRESLLNTITSVGNSDFVRIVTSAGASSKATVANLFKSFESGLGAKSSLGTSDYIRVVGSDNNAYKESVNDVKSAMGVAALEGKLGEASFRIVSITRDTGRNITVPSNYRGLLITADAGATTRNGIYIVLSTSNGSVSLVPVLDASGLTFEKTANILKIISTGTTITLFININGTVTA